MVFGGATGTLPVDLGSLAQYIKPSIINLGVTLDPELKFNSQIKAVVKSSFFHLRQLAKIKPILSRQHYEIHTFVTTRLDYCDALYVGVSGYCLWMLNRPLLCLFLNQFLKPNSSPWPLTPSKRSTLST